MSASGRRSCTALGRKLGGLPLVYLGFPWKLGGEGQMLLVLGLGVLDAGDGLHPLGFPEQVSVQRVKLGALLLVHVLHRAPCPGWSWRSCSRYGLG